VRLLRRRPYAIEDIADGRVWRLERGRDFAGTVRAFRERLDGTAAEMGKFVRTVPDKLRPDRYVWVQFGDAVVELGEPCICGNRGLSRMHRRWARCDVCGRLLHVNEPESLEQMLGPPAAGTDIPEGAASAQTGAGERSPRGKALDAYDEVMLYRHSISDDVEHCFGVGRNAGEPAALLSVRFTLENGRRVPHPDVPGQWHYVLGKALVDQFVPLVDLADLEEGARVSWKIAEDPGPQPAEDIDPAPG
jgi:hypothetical protein